MPNDLYSSLNKSQSEAVKHTDGPAIILAGAGSGKTRVLVHKVVYLIEEKKIDPTSIIMITFTNKAAQEMKARMARILPKLKQRGIGYVGTFHSFCCMILRRDGHALGIDSRFSIYDDDDQGSVLKQILKTYDNKRITPSYLGHRISSAKNMLVTPEKYLEFFSDHQAAHVAELYYRYEKELKKNNALDFDDLIMKVSVMFLTRPEVLEKYQEKYQHILVDEFQDTNYAQYVLTKLLGSKYEQVTVVGDFSQSIYSWRGADIRNLEKFKEDFPGTKMFYLEENYRSTENILNFAYEIISQNQTHPVLKLFTSNDTGEEVEFKQMENEEDEARFIVHEIERLRGDMPYSSFAVLYRTNAQSRVIEEAFLHYSTPYTLIGGTRFYERKEIKDMLSYLRLLVNPTDEVAAERLKKLGKRRWEQFRVFFTSNPEIVDQMETAEIMERIFKETGYLELYNPDDAEDYARLENIKELKSVAISHPKLVEFLETVSLVESEYFEGEKKGRNREGVRLMTMHQAKGLEFEYVFIVGVEEGILPHSRSVDDVWQLEEERRLFYVGITRARRKLYITYAKRRFIFGRRNFVRKSRFLGEDEQPSYDDYPSDSWD